MSDGLPRFGPGPLSPDDWRVWGPLVDGALDVDPNRRATFIAEACRGDAEMAEQLARLVAECEREDVVLDGDAIQRFEFLLDDDEVAPTFPAILAGRYRVDREIGRGGMAIVFLAHDTTHDRPVAIKVMRPSARSHLAAERFSSEIRTTAGLRHPHIVPLYDSGEADESLYFVMPYYEAGTLASRLEREPRLKATDALHIASDVAAALEYAHSAGLVHRDVKPSNILFASGHALLGDFGVARPTSPAQRGLTATGVVIGTPAYMSPEQAVGGLVDARSDIYSLGCVLYEMLTGEAPLAATSRDVLARHAGATLQPIGATRRDLPVSVEQCVARAMALAPADRFPHASELSAALAECSRAAFAPESPSRRAWRSIRRRASTIAATGIASVALAAVLWTAAGRVLDAKRSSEASATAAVDTTRYLLLPYDYAPEVRDRIGGPDRISEAMASWQGIAVVDSFKVADVLAKFPSRPLSGANARAVATSLHAGRYVRREISVGDGGEVMRVSVFDSQTGDALVQLTNPVPRGAGGDSIFASIAWDALFGESPAERSLLIRATRSRPALQSFLKGRRLIDEWNLARADSAFADATRFDPLFPQPHLWAAQVRVWRALPTTMWSVEAERALGGRSRLSLSEQRLADVLKMYATGDTVGACRNWSNVPSETRDFGAWYGAAECLRRDRAVIPDRRSPSKWRFRSSFNAEMKALQRAYQLLPATYQQFREGWYSDLGPRLFTQPTALRVGHALPPDTGEFQAYPSWSATGDTIEFVPFRQMDVRAGRPGVLSDSRGKAIEKQRLLFRDIASTWRAAFPQSSDALLGVAIALDQLGDRSAIDSAHAARELATDKEQRLRAGAAEVWLRVKRAVPSDLGSLTTARLLADSIVKANLHPAGKDAEAVSGLATLIGHAALGAAIARLQPPHDQSVPMAVQSPAQALLVFAAVGGPQDSLRTLETRIESAIREAGDAGDAGDGIRARMLALPATLAFPSYAAVSIRELAAAHDPLATAEAALLDGDSARVLQLLQSAQDRRRTRGSPQDWKLDTLYPEAWLLLAIRNPGAAEERIVPTLEAEERVDMHVLVSPAGAGALVRAMAFRAQLASRASRGDEAALWARAVRTLWADADPFLQRSVVAQMTALSR